MDFKYLKNYRNLKAFFKEASSEDIQFIISKLTEFYAEVKNKEEQAEKLEKARIQFLNGVLDSLDNHNFTVEDLMALKKTGSRENKNKMRPRYMYHDLDGNECLWSGQGKIPKAMQQVMQRDGITDKNHYLIKDSDS